MNPWMLHEVRKDDVESRYKEAERHRLAATLPDDLPSDGDRGEWLAPASRGRPRGRRRVRWIAALLTITALAVTMIVATACGVPAATFPAAATADHQPPMAALRSVNNWAIDLQMDETRCDRLRAEFASMISDNPNWLNGTIT